MGRMKERKEKFRVPILAAGGIVLRNDLGVTPQFAVIQSRKLQTWGLPKGKLADGEDAMTAARREVLEETGHQVTVHEFLGTLVYETNTRPKVIQFWRMEALCAPVGDLMDDVMAVDWLTLPDAIDRLSHMRERVFLEQVGPIALKLARRPAAALSNGRILVPGIIEPRIPEQSVPLAPDATDTPLARAEPELARDPAVQTEAAGQKKWFAGKAPAGKRLMSKTWGWFRHAALLHRATLD
jgi:8-oxo-dGTP diphosphatase